MCRGQRDPGSKSNDHTHHRNSRARRRRCYSTSARNGGRRQPSLLSFLVEGGGEGGRGEGPGENLTPLPMCRGLLVFMDGEEEGVQGEDGLQQQQHHQRGRRRRHRPGTEGSPGDGSTDTGIVGGAIGNRRPTSSSPSSTPSSAFPLEPPSSSTLGEAARRVGAFWSNASDDFADKVRRRRRRTRPLSLLPSLPSYFLSLNILADSSPLPPPSLPPSLSTSGLARSWWQPWRDRHSRSWSRGAGWWGARREGRTGRGRREGGREGRREGQDEGHPSQSSPRRPHLRPRRRHLGVSRGGGREGGREGGRRGKIEEGEGREGRERGRRKEERKGEREGCIEEEKHVYVDERDVNAQNRRASKEGRGRRRRRGGGGRLRRGISKRACFYMRRCLRK